MDIQAVLPFRITCEPANTHKELIKIRFPLHQGEIVLNVDYTFFNAAFTRFGVMGI